MRTLIILCTLACLVATCVVSMNGCTRTNPQIFAADTARVEFRIREGEALDSLRLFEAEFTTGDRTARFAIAFVPPADSGKMLAVRAALVARPGSDARELLRALAQLHDDSLRTAPATRLTRLDIDAVVLGQRLSHARGEDVIAGQFTSQPPDDWLVLKLFLDTPDGATTSRLGEPAEIYVALNLSEARGWFLTKDTEYWPELNQVLATVL